MREQGRYRGKHSYCWQSSNRVRQTRGVGTHLKQRDTRQGQQGQKKNRYSKTQRLFTGFHGRLRRAGSKRAEKWATANKSCFFETRDTILLLFLCFVCTWRLLSSRLSEWITYPKTVFCSPFAYSSTRFSIETKNKQMNERKQHLCFSPHGLGWQGFFLLQGPLRVELR